MKRKLILGVLVLIDSMVVCLTPFLALYIRFDGNVSKNLADTVVLLLPAILFVRLVSFYGFGLYHRLWRYASLHEILAIVGAVTVSSFILTAFLQAVNTALPRSVHLISWILTIALIGLSRICARLWYYFHPMDSSGCTRVLIIGAGDAGAMIAREIRQRYFDCKKLIGFIDDDPYKQHKMFYGVKVLGMRQDIKSIVQARQVTEIIIAMPSVGGELIRPIINECKQTGCIVKILPGIYQIIDGRVIVSRLRDVDLEDLLRRKPVQLNIREIARYLSGRKVLITGAGGSIGSELCRQIASLSPSTLILLGKGENSIYEIDRELREKYPDLSIKPVIADIRDRDRISMIFREFMPEVVFHAAAHKHVPLMEEQAVEAVRNNIFGTKIVAEAAERAGTEIFVMVSTDKAVNPTSVMGATKRVAELIIHHMNQVSETKFVAVRFGNVLGSRGSVVPLFKRQIAQGGPVTVTHPEMRRYFMTIPEATQLVLQAGSMATGGEVFVLDMGEPVKIIDLAQDLIELSGLIPQKDIDIKFTGLRPGEKMFEELLTAEEGTSKTVHSKVFVANLRTVETCVMKSALLELGQTTDQQQIVKILKLLIPTYTASLEDTSGNCNTIKSVCEGESIAYLEPVPGLH